MSRPPCSGAERAAADSLSRSLRRLGIHPRIDTFRAATSPSWVPLLRALLRVWAVALVAAYRPIPATALASVAIAGGLPSLGLLVRFVPILGGVSQNVVARINGTDAAARPVVVVGHIDTHPAARGTMQRAQSAVGSALGWIALAAAIFGRPAVPAWRAATALVAVEALVTLTWLARRELTTITEMPDDNTSGLLALISVGTLVCNQQPTADVWIVGTGAGTSGGYGMRAFLRRYPELQSAWIVEIDALGAGEVVAAPHSSRFPRPGTPSALVRALVAASQATGDPLDVRRLRRDHSDARAALRLRTPAITLTAGLRPPAPEPAPDPANAERAARVVDRLARSAA